MTTFTTAQETKRGTSYVTLLILFQCGAVSDRACPLGRFTLWLPSAVGLIVASFDCPLRSHGCVRVGVQEIRRIVRAEGHRVVRYGEVC